VAATVLALAVGLVAGCGDASGTQAAGTAASSAAPSASGTPMTGCGTTRTAAGVRVDIEVEQGPVPCAAALGVERDYARDLASGKVQGNGGGAPVKVRGWVCQGFATPEVLATGHASVCKKGAARIVAVLKMPATSSPSSSPSS
jgi:hypothetical protein